MESLQKKGITFKHLFLHKLNYLSANDMNQNPKS